MSAQDSAKTVEILEKLKSAILNIDWEISDENITLLNQELAGLRKIWEGQKVHQIYLQILGALSQYIATNKENANPGASPMLSDVFASLEDMVMNPGDEEQQNQRVMKHVEAYNDLKNAVAAGETPVTAEPEPEAEIAETEPEPEVVAEEEPSEEQEEPSTINRLLNDDEDHTTDSIFDSMLDEMVQTEPPDGDSGPEVEAEPESTPEPEPEPAAASPSPPKAPPPVQAAYNKDDGTEIEADRNIADEFAEADELLDDFFVDDVAAPSGVASGISGDEFDLSALDEGEGGVLDLDEPSEAEDEEGGLEPGLEEAAAEPEVPEEELELVEDSELDIFRVDEPEEADASPASSAEGEEEFPEMESALDDFFEGEPEAEAPSMATPEPASDPVPAETIKEVDDALDEVLDDFFEDDEQEVAEVGGEALDLVVEAPVPPTTAAEGTVEGLKALLVSVDWEVGDQLLERVDGEISALRDTLSENHTALIHLDFLSTVIHHIGEREHSQVISESMTCLKMITESLENLVKSDGANDSQFAAQAVSSFVDWHELVVAEFEKRLNEIKKHGGDLADSLETLELETGKGDTTETQKLKKEILSEVREILSKEMMAIRQELSAKG